DTEALPADPRGFDTLIHLDIPWDPRRLSRRLARLEAASDVRIFHLALVGSVEDQLLGAYQEAFPMGASHGEVDAVLAEAPDDPEVSVGAAVVVGEGAFEGWAATLKACSHTA